VRTIPILHPNKRDTIGYVVAKENIGTFKIERDNTQRFNKKAGYIRDEGLAISRYTFQQFTEIELKFGIKVKYILVYCRDLRAEYIITVEKFLNKKVYEDYSETHKENCDSKQLCVHLSEFTKIPKGQRTFG